MASLISWTGGFNKKKRADDILNTLSNFDVRTNNAAVNSRRFNSTPAVSQNANNNINSTTFVRNETRQNANSVLRTLGNLDVRSGSRLNNNFNNSIKRINNTKTDLNKLHLTNGGTLDDNGRMNFEDFKATMNAKNIIDKGGTGAPYKVSVIKNAEAIRNADQPSPLAKLNSMTTLASSKNYNAKNDSGWKKYYDEEFRKARDSQNFFQRLMDQGSASRLAETNARNRYASELLDKAFDDNGNVKNQNIANNVKTLADYNSSVTKTYNEMEHAKSRKIGASYDSDYYTGYDWDPDKNKAGTNGDLGKALELLGKQLKGTANVIHNMSVADAITGANDTQKTDLADAGKFILDLVPGMLTAPVQGGTNIAEAISGSGTDAETGKERNLDALERAGRGLSGAIDAAGVFFGGSGDLLNSVGEAIFKKGASETTKQVLKQTGKEVLKNYIKAMVEEGAEEGVQQAFEFFGDGGKLITKDGEFDSESFKQLLQETGQAAALGAVGGGIFKAGGDAINFASNTANKISSNLNNNNIGQRVDLPTRTELNNLSQNFNNDENLAENTQYNSDGNAYKVNENGTASRLSDEELVSVASTTQPITNEVNQAQTQNVVEKVPEVQTKAASKTINPIRDNSVINTTLSKNELTDLLTRASNGDAEAIRILEEYGYKPENTGQQTGWRPKTVDEVINPEDSKAKTRQEQGPTEGSIISNSRDSAQFELSDRIDTVLTNPNYRQPVMLRGSTPDALVNAGIKDLPMYENPSHIRNNILTESEAKNAGIFRDGDHYHGLGKDIFMEAINGLDVPRAVFKKNGTDNDYFVLTAVKDSSGNTVVVPIQVETATNVNHVWIDTNRIKTIFGFDDNAGLDKYIKGNVKSGEFTKIEPNGARVSDTAGSIDAIVPRSAEKVNANNPIFQYYQKYGNDFYEKMPWDLQTKYEELLDRQPRDGQGRYVDPITGDVWINQTAETEPAKLSQNNENVKTTEAERSYKIESESLPNDFDVKHYVTDQVQAQKARSKVPLRERIADATTELKHYLVDDAVAYERYIKDKNERLGLREGVDRVRSSDMIARQYMDDHGLGEIGKMPDADLNEFQQYLIAKRAQEVEAQGKKTGRSKAADQALIDSVGNKYAKQEAIIRQYTHDMLEYSAENGLISKKLKNKLIEENPNYVPMNRVFDVVEKKTGFKSKQLGNLNNQSVIQKMTGSERAVDNPIESLMSNTMRMINEAERNKVAKLISQSEAFHEKVLKDGEKPRAGYDKLSYMVDGETVSYEVPELVAREMKNLNNVLPKAADNILKVVGAPTRWLRSGATQNNPIFAASNLLRDQMQTLVTSNVTANLRGTKDAIVATFSPGKRGKELRAELNRAGIIGSEYRQTYGYKSGDLMAQLQADNNIKKGAVERIKHPMDALGDLIGRTEYFTRAQQYFGTNGDATTKAQAARNNTLNFGRAGATTRILNRIIPFLNAGVQGGRITVNSFKNRPIHTTLAMATLTGVALAAKGAAEAQNKELWDRIDDSDKGQNIIIFTPDAHYNSESNRVEGIIKIPVAQMLYPLMDAANNMEGDASDATKLAGDIFTAVTGLEAPNEDKGLLPVVNQLTPTAVKPFLEAAMNKSSYTGNDLVSEYDSNKAPEDKGAKYTTGLARAIAGVTGIDAPVVDNFIQNWGGGLAKDLSKVMTDNPDNTKDSGGIGAMFENGFNRRFLSGTVESQYEIAEGLAKNYKNEVKNSDTFKNLTSEQQQKVLNAIDSDMNSIASLSAKVEQGRANEDSSLTKRQTEIVANGFSADDYIKAVTDKNATYKGSGTKGAGQTLTDNVLDYGKTASKNSAIEVNSSISNDSKSILERYNSMTSDEWNDYLYGDNAENAAAEYNLAKAKYENDLASGKLSEVQKIKRQKELEKLKASQNYTKDVRDVYSLAGNKEDIQALLNSIENPDLRNQMMRILNGLNNTLYQAGIITASTYNSRGRNINNLEKNSSKKSSSSSKSAKKAANGISSAEANAITNMVKSTAKNADGYDVEAPSKPSTSRQMQKTRSKGNSESNNVRTYTPKKATISVRKSSSKK